MGGYAQSFGGISIHALLAESDESTVDEVLTNEISIHALLAESDHCGADSTRTRKDFYPRSPCGERRKPGQWIRQRKDFYPRSPCGERPVPVMGAPHRPQFLSTLSLRRATFQCRNKARRSAFLSTLSLRRATHKPGLFFQQAVISIHALLAESDRSQPARRRIPGHFYPRSPCGERPRAIKSLYSCWFSFLSTLSLRRATAARLWCRSQWQISIHALLAESDGRHSAVHPAQLHFYPRSPCGERPGKAMEQDGLQTISIHALLAESDFATTAGRKPAKNFYPRSPCGERPASRPSSAGISDFYPRSPCGERLTQR